jgi:hypothetical protein
MSYLPCFDYDEPAGSDPASDGGACFKLEGFTPEFAEDEAAAAILSGARSSARAKRPATPARIGA